MKKITLLLACVFFAGVTLQAFAMGDRNKEATTTDSLALSPPNPVDKLPDCDKGLITIISLTERNESDTRAPAPEMRSPINRRELGLALQKTERLLKKLDQKKTPEAFKETSKTILSEVQALLDFAEKNPQIFAPVQAHLQILNEQCAPLRQIASNERLYISPQQIAEAIHLIAVTTAQISSIVAPALLKTKSRWGSCCVFTCVGIVGLGLGLVGIGNTIHWWNVPIEPGFYMGLIRNVTTAYLGS